VTLPESQEVDPRHAARLTTLKFKKDKIKYAAEVLHRETGSVNTADVADWLVRYGVVRDPRSERPGISAGVSAYRKEHDLDDTNGPVPVMTKELLEELDAQRDGEVVPFRARRTGSPAPAKPDAGQDASAPKPDGRTDGQDASAGRVSPKQDASALARPRRAPLVLGLISLVAMGVSADTSLRFFGERLHVPDPYRFFLFAVMELTLLGSALAMFESVRDHQRPGPMRWVAWAVCAVSAFAALELSGPLDGPIRTLLGPVLALVLLHAALGIEIRAQKTRTTVWAKIASEYRERFLSRLGLGDDDRDAATRTRERAAVRLAHLAAVGWTPFRRTRMRRAARIAGTAHDPEIKARVEREHHTLSQLDALAKVKHGSFWNAR
jgi:hypothetical protein